MPGLSKQQIIAKIRRLFLRREPLNLSAVKRRHPELVERVYALRPFWGWKQALEEAGVDYSNVNVELQDHCTCLICGAEAAILTSHLRGSHGLTPVEYRAEFPGAEIMAETIRAARMRAKAAVPHWEPVWSLEYVLDRLWVFHQRGWSLNNIEIQRRERSMFSFIAHQGLRWDEVLRSLGFDPAAIRKVTVGAHLSKQDVIRRLKGRFRKGLSLAQSRLVHEDLQLLNAARRRFGTYENALLAAGIDPGVVRRRIPRVTQHHLDELKAEMQRVASLHGHERARAALHLKKRYTGLVFNRLENWRLACKRFRIRFEDLATHPYASRQHVIEALRRLPVSPRPSLYSLFRTDRSLGTAVYKFFKSWGAALRAASRRN